MLLEHRKAQYESQDDEHELSEVFTKTLDYCQTFSKYNSKETIKVCCHNYYAVSTAPAPGSSSNSQKYRRRYFNG